MSFYAPPDSSRSGHTVPPIYQIDGSTQVVPPRPSTPERIRERQVKSIPPPYAHTPRDEDLFLFDPATGEHKPNVELLRDHFFHEGRLREDQAKQILEQAIVLMSQEPNLLRVTGPATVVGDIHGQYYDLMKVFEVGGRFDENKYVFLGDYVDRGYFGIECLLYVYALKLCYPSVVFLLRGNHECRHLTGYFTFKKECLHKYSEEIYETCIRSFQALPVTALIDDKFFCVHGGISPDLVYLSDLNTVLNRSTEPASKGLLCDLLWADPIVNYGHEGDVTQHNPQGLKPPPFIPNDVRGCSYFFTYQATSEFLSRNKLLGIFRGHEAQDHGYMMYRKTPGKQFPSLITVFSAPNYLDVYHNKGAVIKYKDKTITIRQYNSSSHPYWLPNFMNAFTWSLPFVAGKILEMLLGVLAVCSEEELEASEEDLPGRIEPSNTVPPQEVTARRQEIKNKIMAVGKMRRLYAILRETTEGSTELLTGAPLDHEGHTPWPGGFASPSENDQLGNHIVDIRRQIRSFDEARHADIVNERMPQFEEAAAPGMATPSTWIPHHVPPENGATTLGHINHEDYIRQVLQQESDLDADTAERIAEKLAKASLGSMRPRGLRRFDTA